MFVDFVVVVVEKKFKPEIHGVKSHRKNINIMLALIGSFVHISLPIFIEKPGEVEKSD